MKLLILQNFRVFAPQTAGPDGKARADRRIQYTKGMVIDEIPDGQSADDWLAKGLAKVAERSPGGAAGRR